MFLIGDWNCLTWWRITRRVIETQYRRSNHWQSVRQTCPLPGRSQGEQVWLSLDRCFVSRETCTKWRYFHRKTLELSLRGTNIPATNLQYEGDNPSNTLVVFVCVPLSTILPTHLSTSAFVSSTFFFPPLPLLASRLPLHPSHFPLLCIDVLWL